MTIVKIWTKKDFIAHSSCILTHREGTSRMHNVGVRRKSQVLGSFCLITGVVCNKFVIEALVAGDGKISNLSVNIAILVLQVAFIAAGLLYLKQSYRMLANLGIGLLLMFVLQFWMRVLIELPYPEKRMFKALPPVPSMFQTGLQYQDQVSRYEDRFHGIKKMLPSHGVVGYVTSPHLSAEEAKFHRGLTAYVLVPLQVVRSTEPELIIGNFPDFEQTDYRDNIVHLTPLKDFGNGVLLLDRKDTP